MAPDSLDSCENDINKEANKIATELKTKDRIYKCHKEQAFVIIKDHKLISKLTHNTLVNISSNEHANIRKTL